MVTLSIGGLIGIVGGSLIIGGTIGLIVASCIAAGHDDSDDID